MASSIPRVCIIGAGPGGLSAHIQLKFRNDEGHGPFHVVGFESQSSIGGNWNRTWRKGLTESGDNVHSGMYNDLFTNGPAELNEYADYTYLDHFGKAVPSHPPRAAVLDYLRGRAKKYDVEKNIQFDTAVRWVSFDEGTKEFTVKTEKLKTGEKRKHIFDYVIVATSFVASPYTPDIPGVESFDGPVMHSHDIRNEFRNGFFKDKTVLAIGASFSSEDMILQSLKFGAKAVHIAYRRAPMKDTPATEHPELTRFEAPRTAYFKDGSSVEADVVIFCTGYKLNYPFMEDKLRFRGKSEWYQDHLYKGSCYIEGGNNQLFYSGTFFTAYSFSQYELQAFFASRIIAKTLELPPVEEMRKDIKKWLDRKSSMDEKDLVSMCQFQTDYLIDLSEMTGFKHAVDGQALWVKALATRHVDLYTYRDQTFPSLHTGTESAIPKVPFMKNFDDSLEAYISA